MGAHRLRLMDRASKHHAIGMLSDILRPIAPWLESPEVQEIMVNGPDDVWIEEGGVTKRLEVSLNEISIGSAIDVLARIVGKTADKNGPNAIIDARLEGLRFAAALETVSSNGPSICIRRHNPVLLSMEDYVRMGALDPIRAQVIREAVANRKNILVSGGTSSGKAQPLDALVLTPGGFVQMGSLRVGNKVLTPEGKAVVIRGVYPQGQKEVFRITFRDGRTSESCGEHLWRVWTRTSVWSSKKKRKERSVGWRVIPLREVIRRVEERRSLFGRLAVPTVAPYAIEYAPEELPIPPYTLGVLIGDGNVTGSPPVVSSADQYVLDRIMAELPGFGFKWRGGVDFRQQPTRRTKISALRVSLEELGLFGLTCERKFIPERYKRGTVAQRCALVQGLMDADGFVSKNGGIQYATSSERLAADLQDVIWSLGGCATVSVKQPTFTGTDGRKKHGRLSYVLNISHPVPNQLVSLPRKLERIKPRQRYWRLGISKIESVGYKDCQCISIDSEDGLYVTDNYVVTHNTTALNAMIAMIGADERVLSIEDTRELRIEVPNWVALEANEQAHISIRHLVKLALRYRPDRIIVGEVRGPEAFDLMQAMNTGHDGGLATIHANSARDALSRLEGLVLTTPDVDWPLEAIRDQIGRTFDYVIHLERTKVDGRAIRRFAEIAAIRQYDHGRRDYELSVVKGES